jgi:hypothetical protein
VAKAPSGFYTILDFMAMSEFERQMAISEYRNLVQTGALGAIEAVRDPEAAVASVKKKVRRKKSKYSRALSRELKAARAAATTKSGKLRKGMTPAKIMKKAHRAAKRRLK